MWRIWGRCAPLVTLLVLQHCANAQIRPTTLVKGNAATRLPDNVPRPANETQLGYCAPQLCMLYNGTDFVQVPHIACHNNGSFGAACGSEPHLLLMSARRRQLILDMHNLARARVAAGQLEGYQPAAHMPALIWDDELEHLATLHVRRCQFAHDQCRNTRRFPYSGQNIGYYWIGRSFKSHSKRMKSFILNWYREYRLANQSYIDNYQPHPENKIGHFTMMVADRAERVGCAAIRFRDPSEPTNTKFLMTCNYDYTNIIGEPIYRSGTAASKCTQTVSKQFPSLCDSTSSLPRKGDNALNIKDDHNSLNNNI